VKTKYHDVLFNADKSKCIISRPRGLASGGNLNHDVCFSISGNVIENVQSWPHLGHVIGLLPIMLAISWIF